MSTEQNAVPETRPDSPPATAAASAALPKTRLMYWSVRRELWENRSLYIGPLAAAVLMLVGFLVSTLALPQIVEALPKLSPAQQHAVIAKPYDIAAMLIMITTFLVGAFYCLDALHGERRDRSILFWKSLPVSDVVTVLSKASIPLVGLPLLAFAIIVVTQLVMLLASTLILQASGTSAAPVWEQLQWFRMSALLLYGLVTLALWHAPVYAWLLLVSGWARRTPFLWAVLPPLGLVVVEKVALDTSYLAGILTRRLTGGHDEAFAAQAEGRIAGGKLLPVDPFPDPMYFLSSPSLWIGLAFAAAFIVAAIWLRRNRGPL